MAGFEKETCGRRLEEKIRLSLESPNVTFLHRLAGTVGAAYLHFVGKTSFVHSIDHPSALAYRRDKKPVVYAFWHNAQVFLAYEHRGCGEHIIVSRSKDGEYIAQVMKRLGLNAVRGSTSKGGDAALRDMCELLAQGKQVGFTPDGPRGPVQTVHGGVVMAAQVSGCPIVPVAYKTSNSIVFNSWDKFVLPLPFSSVVVSHGKPFFIDKDMPVENAKELVRKALNENVTDCEHGFARMHPWSADVFAGLFTALYTLLTPLIAVLSLPIFLLKYGGQRTFNFLGERLKLPPAPAEGERRLWLHAASVGEWQALRPVLERLKKKSVSFLITVNTPEARVIVAREQPDAVVRMVPLDLPWVLSRWIRQARPYAVGIIETELWPNMIRQLNRANVPVFLLNGRLSERSLNRWVLARPFIQSLMMRFSDFFIRTDLDARRYFKLGAPLELIHVTGNTKYDNLDVTPLSDEERHLKQERREKTFGPAGGVIVIAGSTWDGEEEALLKIFNEKAEPHMRLILAPRRLSRAASVAKLLEKIPSSWSLWSKVKQTGQWDTDILLVDTLGDLKELYRVADVAFVGGSLIPHGGQNPLEPAAAGLPVLFGPSMENFHEEAAELKRQNAARESRHEGDLLSDIRELTMDENIRNVMGAAAARFVLSKQGASDRTADGLAERLGL